MNKHGIIYAEGRPVVRFNRFGEKIGQDFSKREHAWNCPCDACEFDRPGRKPFPVKTQTQRDALDAINAAWEASKNR